MGKRKTPRLTEIEYDSRDHENSEAVHQARMELMRAIKRVFPEFLEKLSADVFPLYEKLAAQGKLAKDGRDFMESLWSDSPGSTAYDVLTQDGGLKVALGEWADQFNARVLWIMLGALRTLWDWRAFSVHRQSLQWEPGYSRTGSSPAIGETFEFSFQAWETQHFTWAKYREVIRQRFEEKLSKYEKETRKLAESRDLIRTPLKYSPANLKWFVLYQFAGQSSTRIAKRLAEAGNPVDDSTVLKGIKAAAKRIGWESLRTP